MLELLQEETTTVVKIKTWELSRLEFHFRLSTS